LACSTIRCLAGLSNSDRGGCIVLGVARIVSAPIELYRKFSIFRANLKMPRDSKASLIMDREGSSPPSKRV
jgi:hypothetical protein